jgi:hypothetical protein
MKIQTLKVLLKTLSVCRVSYVLKLKKYEPWH